MNYKELKLNVFSQFLLGILFMFVTGCVSVHSGGMIVPYKTIKKEPPTFYKIFVRKYPNSLSAEALERIDDPGYAFIRTCQIGTRKAFQNFIDSYPSSVYVQISKRRIEFLEKVNLRNFKSNKQFISEHHKNPFVVESKIRFPILWLKNRHQRVGVSIKIGDLMKGLLINRNRNLEKIRQNVFQKIRDSLASEGLEAILMSGSKSTDELKNTDTVIVVHYNEKRVEPSVNQAELNRNIRREGYGAAFQHAEAEKNLGEIFDILFGISNKVVRMNIKNPKDNTEYYSGLCDLSSMYKEINVKQLNAIGWNFSPLQYIVMALDKKVLFPIEKKIYLDLLDNLSAPGIGVNPRAINSDNSLMWASFVGNSEIVKALINKGANVNAKTRNGYTPLIMASLGDHSKIVDVLLAKGANINAEDNDGLTPLMAAILKDHKDVVTALINKGANVNAKVRKEYVPLIVASQLGRGEIVDVLLANGANINVEDKDGWTASMWAYRNGHSEILKSLLFAQQSAINAKDYNDNMALINAVEWNHGETVKTLLNKGANVNARANFDATALFLASQRGESNIVDTLLAHGADVNAKTYQGFTALQVGANLGYVEIVKTLLAHGADVNGKDVFGKTALMGASQNGHSKVVKILKAAGAIAVK